MRRVVLAAAAGLLCSSCAVLGYKGDCAGNELIATFEQVGDLVENANVQSSDVVVGTITDIELDGWNARVSMCLNEDESIPADARAVVRTTSLLGEKFIDLQSETSGSGPYLDDGDILDLEQTGKATELEDVFAKLATVLGTGNLEQINRFTSSQAKILRANAGDLRTLLADLRQFTDNLASQKIDIGLAVDSLDSVADTVLAEAGTLEEFLQSFASSSTVLSNQKSGLEDLLFALDRFTSISVELLSETERGLNKQFRGLRPVLRTIVENSRDFEQVLTTLATFVDYFPESMPGDYLQLDVCQAAPDDYDQGITCPQSDQIDDPRAGSAATGRRGRPESSLELILERPLEGPR